MFMYYGNYFLQSILINHKGLTLTLIFPFICLAIGLTCSNNQAYVNELGPRGLQENPKDVINFALK